MGENNFEIDVKDFCFRQMCKLQVFAPPPQLITDAVNLVASSNRFGKIFVAAGTEMKMIDVSVIENLTSAEDADLSQVVTSFDHKSIDTRKEIRNIAISCDDLTLSVVYNENGSLWIGCVDVRYFGLQGIPTCFFAQGQLTNESGVYLCELEWNPEDPTLGIICLSNGTVSLVKVTENSVNIISSIPAGKKAYSINWSPKGKNFAAGHEDGTVILYDKKMTVKKELPCLEELKSSKHRVSKVRWIMSHNFAAVYVNTETEEPPKFVCIVTHKDDPTVYVNMEDVYFGLNEERTLCFYLETLPIWNILVTMASNAFEAVLIGKIGDKWMRWALDDDSRAEMPLTDDRDETFPCGIALNLNSTLTTQEGESTLPPSPIFLMLSTHGVLCPYQMVNKMQGVNHQILIKSSAMIKEGIRKPLLLSQQPESRAAEPQTGAAKSSLPKPFGDFEKRPDQGVALPSQQPSAVPPPAVPAPSSVPRSATPSGFTFGGGAPSLFGASGSTGGLFSAAKPQGLFTPTGSQETSNKETSSPSASTDTSLKDKENATNLAAAKPFSFDSKASLFQTSTKPLFGAPSAVGPTPETGVQAAGKSVETKKPLFGSLSTAFSSQPSSQTLGGAVESNKPVFGMPSTTSALQVTAKTPFSFVAPRPQPTTQTQFGNLTLGGSPVPQSSPKPEPPSVPAPVSLAESKSVPQSKPTILPEVSARQELPSGKVPPESRLLQSTPAIGQPLFKPQIKPETSNADAVAQPPSKLEEIEPAPESDFAKIDDMVKQLGKDIDRQIEEEVISFSKELSSFKAEMSDCKEIVDGIGTVEEMGTLRREAVHFKKKIADFKDCHDEHRNEFSQHKNKMLRQFDNLEQARVLQTTIHDKRYNNLLKTRSLDPVASRQQKELRSQINYLTALMSDVNDSLDLEWEQAKMTAGKRSKTLKSNSIHNLYVAMESIDKVINNLADRVEAITLQAEKDNLISKPFGERHSFLSHSRIEDDEKSFALKSNMAAVSESKVHFSPMKQAQFKSILSKRGSPPRRKVHHNVSDTSLTVRPKAASTPAVNTASRKIFQYSSETPMVNGHQNANAIPSTIMKANQSLHMSISKSATGPKTDGIPKTQSKLPDEKPASFLQSAITTSSSTTGSIKASQKPIEKSDLILSQTSSSAKVGGISGKAGKGFEAVPPTSSAIPMNFPVNKAGGLFTKPDEPENTKDGAPGKNTAVESSSQGILLQKQEVPVGKTLFQTPVNSAAQSFQFKTTSTGKPDSFGVLPVSSSNQNISLSNPSALSFQPSSSTSNVFSETSKFGIKPFGVTPATAIPFPSSTASSKPAPDVADKVESNKSGFSMLNIAVSTSIVSGLTGATAMTSEKPPTTTSVAKTLPSANTPFLGFQSTLAETASKQDMPNVFASTAVSPLAGSASTSSGKPTMAASSAISSSGTSIAFSGTKFTLPESSAKQDTPSLFGSITMPAPLLFTSRAAPAPTISPMVTPESSKLVSSAATLFDTKTLTSTTKSSTEIFGSKSTNLFGVQQSASIQSSGSKSTETVSAATVVTSSLFAAQTLSFVQATGNKTAESSAGIFGSKTTVTTSLPAFGVQSSSSSETSDTKVTGSSTNIPSTSIPLPLFGAPSSKLLQPVMTKATESASVATAAVTTTSSVTSMTSSSAVFGSGSTFPAFGARTSDTKPSLFGSTTTTTNASLLGTLPIASTSANSLTSKPTGSSSSLFGSKTSETQAPLFGGSGSSSSLFGAPATSADKPSLFGSKPGSSSGLFGQATSSTSSGFGSQQSSGLFSSKPSNSQANSTGLFGSASSSSSSGVGLFGSKATTSSGGLFPTSNTSQSSFGQSPSTFGSQQSTAGAGMGFGGFGLGGKPTNDPSKNPFGSVPSASSASSGSSGLFGASSQSSPFGAAQNISTSSKGSFSQGFGSGFMGSGTSTGFGSTAATTGSAFGGGASFGGGPSFGGSPAFGGSPTFGPATPSGFGTGASTGASFGSSSSGFGQQASFGSFAQQSSPSFGQLSSQAGTSSFGSLSSNQNQPSFGNIAQQDSFGQSGSMFGQQSSPQGSSFSSWR